MIGVATALLAGGAVVLMRPVAPPAARAAGLCNGSAALCDRRLDQVTFAGVHNAMSAADVPGWMFPQHERGVSARLADGDLGLLPAFDVMQEAPCKFRTPEEMSCASNRGGTRGSLFQINNWIDTTPNPKPSNTAIVTAYNASLARARRCQAERGLKPTILAVDFYRTGDLVSVVRALNQ